MRLLRAFIVCWGFGSVWSFCGLAGACGAFYGAFMAFRLLGYCSQISQHWRGPGVLGVALIVVRALQIAVLVRRGCCIPLNAKGL